MTTLTLSNRPLDLRAMLGAFWSVVASWVATRLWRASSQRSARAARNAIPRPIRNKIPAWGCALQGTQLTWAQRVIGRIEEAKRLFATTRIWTVSSTGERMWDREISAQLDELFGDRGMLWACHARLGELTSLETGSKWLDEVRAKLNVLIARLNRADQPLSFKRTRHELKSGRQFEVTMPLSRPRQLLEAIRRELESDVVSAINAS